MLINSVASPVQIASDPFENAGCDNTRRMFAVTGSTITHETLRSRSGLHRSSTFERVGFT